MFQWGSSDEPLAALQDFACPGIGPGGAGSDPVGDEPGIHCNSTGAGFSQFHASDSRIVLWLDNDGDINYDVPRARLTAWEFRR